MPQEPALCAPCGAVPLTHGCLESGTLASGYTYEYRRGEGSPFALKPEVSLPFPLSTPGGPLRRPGLSWRWGTPETRPGTAGLNEAWGTLTHLSCWGGGGPGVRPHTQSSSPALGSGRSLRSRVPVSQMGTWTTGRKGSRPGSRSVPFPTTPAHQRGLLGAPSRGHPGSCPQDPPWGQAGPRDPCVELAGTVWERPGFPWTFAMSPPSPPSPHAASKDP